MYELAVQVMSNICHEILKELYVTLGHKISHKDLFLYREIYTPSKKINKSAFHWHMVCYDRKIFGRDTTIWKSGIWKQIITK